MLVPGLMPGPIYLLPGISPGPVFSRRALRPGHYFPAVPYARPISHSVVFVSCIIVTMS
jgi:hypothetical protein